MQSIRGCIDHEVQLLQGKSHFNVFCSICDSANSQVYQDLIFKWYLQAYPETLSRQEIAGRLRAHPKKVELLLFLLCSVVICVIVFAWCDFVKEGQNGLIPDGSEGFKYYRYHFAHIFLLFGLRSVVSAMQSLTKNA